MKVFLFHTELHIEWRIHALQQMISRNISRKDFFDVLNSGEIIESYPEDIHIRVTSLQVNHMEDRFMLLLDMHKILSQYL